MKTTILMGRVLCAVILVVFSLVGCEEVEVYSINAPSDLQNRIDSIAAAKAARNSGDTTYLDIATVVVGAEDNSTAWNGAYSDFFKIPTGKLLHLEFVNHSSGVNNWNNWNLAITNVEESSEDYSPEAGQVGYFTLRSDAFGWGNDDYDEGLISHNYPTVDGQVGGEFISIMNGAYVTLEVDHSATGNAFVTATAIGTNGTELVMTYNQPVSATEDIVAFLVTDGSHFEMKEAYLVPSQITVLEDVEPVSIAIAGAPASVEIGEENFWGDATATVTYADGSSAQVDSTDLSFNVIPDMTTVGEKTVVVAYSKTKQGEYTQAVSTYYKLQVTNAVSSLEVTTEPDITTYYYFNNDPIIFNPKGLVVTATYSDGSTGVLSNENLEFGTITATEGPQTVDVSYEGATSTVTTEVPLTLVKGVSQVGATDFSTTWWTEFSDDYTVPSGESKTIRMYTYSNNLQSYHSPTTILRKADDTEYAVVRMDNYGWLGNQNTLDNLDELGWALASDWNWDTFTSNISGSRVAITVTNNGDGTADVRYDVTYANGETHFQEYAGIAVESSDLNFALVTEGAYLVIVE